MKDLREQLAHLCHEQWSGWMKYLFEKCTGPFKQGELIIPTEYVARWYRQLSTRYKDLPENEQESDRIEADKFLELLKPYLAEVQNHGENIDVEIRSRDALIDKLNCEIKRLKNRYEPPCPDCGTRSVAIEIGNYDLYHCVECGEDFSEDDIKESNEKRNQVAL